MRNYFIFQYEDLVSSGKKLIITTIFIHQSKIQSQNELAQEINSFYQEHSITDILVVILPSYLDTSSIKYFREKKENTFVRVPGKTKKFLDESLLIYEFDSLGKLKLIEGSKPKNEEQFIKQLIRSGSTTIFKKNGGLVESSPDHHFVFPSKKHCAKFIRTGNVLIHHAEIFFLSIQLLKHFHERSYIYCDTSSINVLPYTVFELLRRFGNSFECPTVNSFESYELFESHTDSFPASSLVLISASTSGNIIERLIKEKRAEREQIQVIYFLGSSTQYSQHASNIICNLTKDESEFPLGELPFKTYTQEKCDLCTNHSRPIYIRSDVFLTVQPRVEKHLLSTKPEYLPKNLSLFVEKFRGYSKTNAIIKVFYKDVDANSDYEIYFDYGSLIENVIDGKFIEYKETLDRFIDKNIPANTKYLVHLPDIGSEKLATYIKSNINREVNPTILKFNSEFQQEIKEKKGTLVIVASCIPTGKKLLQISRLMRDYEHISLVYFIGFFRPVSESFAKDLISDLVKGKDRSDERPFIPVEKMYCSIRQKNTSWATEKNFLEEMLDSIDETKQKKFYNFINSRIDILRENKTNRGLSKNVFLPTYNGKELYLRKNFAFWNFSDYDEDNIAQSEVYFTISTIITQLENNDINSHPSLKQTNYVRNILSPRNFHRFNDGIIQASLLRSGKRDYFSYDLDEEANLQMKEFLLSIIGKYDTEDGEALLEFLLAIGLRKLNLMNEDLEEVLLKAEGCDNEIISGFSKYISNQLLQRRK